MLCGTTGTEAPLHKPEHKTLHMSLIPPTLQLHMKPEICLLNSKSLCMLSLRKPFSLTKAKHWSDSISILLMLNPFTGISLHMPCYLPRQLFKHHLYCLT